MRHDGDRLADGEQRRRDREQQHVLDHVRGEVVVAARVERRSERDQQGGDGRGERARLRGADDAAACRDRRHSGAMPTA